MVQKRRGAAREGNRMAALESEATKLKRALTDLRHHWEDLQPIWRDRASRSYEQELLEPLIEATERAIRALEQAAAMHARLRERIRQLREQG